MWSFITILFFALIISPYEKDVILYLNNPRIVINRFSWTFQRNWYTSIISINNTFLFFDLSSFITGHGLHYHLNKSRFPSHKNGWCWNWLKKKLLKRIYTLLLFRFSPLFEKNRLSFSQRYLVGNLVKNGQVFLLKFYCYIFIIISPIGRRACLLLKHIWIPFTKTAIWQA